MGQCLCLPSSQTGVLVDDSLLVENQPLELFLL